MTTRSRELIAYLRGGLGNQLFQYSAGICLANSSLRNLVISGALLPSTPDSFNKVSRWPFALSQLDKLPGKLVDLQGQPKDRTSLKSKCFTLAEQLSQLIPKTASGFGFLGGNNLDLETLMSGRRSVRLVALQVKADYAIQCKQLLQNSLRFLLNTSAEYERLVDITNTEDPTIIHFRSGDYENLRHIYGEQNVDYWARSMALVSSNKPVWLFTDSNQPHSIFRKLGFKPERTFGQDLDISPVELLHLLTKGSSFIGSNSTLSWWAGLLGHENRTIIMPRSDSAQVSIQTISHETLTSWHWI